MSDLTIKLNYGPSNAFKGMTFASLTDAQKEYALSRDESLRGASGWGDGLVFKDGEQIALISYNGRAWTNDKKTLIAIYPYEKQSDD